MSALEHVRGLALAELLRGPKSAVQVAEAMRIDGVKWPARSGARTYPAPTYERVMSALVAMEPRYCVRTMFTGPRGRTWRLTEEGRERARAALKVEHASAAADALCALSGGQSAQEDRRGA